MDGALILTHVVSWTCDSDTLLTGPVILTLIRTQVTIPTAVRTLPAILTDLRTRPVIPTDVRTRPVIPTASLFFLILVLKSGIAPTF